MKPRAQRSCNDAIENGMCDFFIMNRPLTVDPEYVNKLREGRLDEIAPCTRCLHCHFDYTEDGVYYEHCRVNAATQRAWHDEMPEGATPLPADGDKKVMVIGGNAQAVDAAQYLIAQGKHVIMVSPEGKEHLDKGQSSWVKQFTIPMLYANGMRLWPNASVKEVRDGSVVIDGETGCDIVVKCDTVIDARDMLPNARLIDGLDIPAVAVGDCNSPFNIAEAIAAGNIAARRI